MFSIAVARGRLGSAERRVLTSRMVERISRREAFTSCPGRNSPERKLTINATGAKALPPSSHIPVPLCLPMRHSGLASLACCT